MPNIVRNIVNGEFTLSKKYDYYGLCIITFNVTSWTLLSKPKVSIRRQLGLSIQIVSKVDPITESKDFTYYVFIDRKENPFFICNSKIIEEYSRGRDELKLFAFENSEIYSMLTSIMKDEDIMERIESIKVVLDIENKIYLDIC